MPVGCLLDSYVMPVGIPVEFLLDSLLYSYLMPVGAGALPRLPLRSPLSSQLRSPLCIPLRFTP
jgi:hypothetical protein